MPRPGARIEPVMAEAEKVILYTAPHCGNSDRARGGLKAEDLAFEERNVMTNKEWFDDVVKYTIFVPLLVYPGGRIEIGWKGRVG